MGRYLRETNIVIAVVGVEAATAHKISDRLTMRGPDDLGDIRVRGFDTLESCLQAMAARKVDAICLGVSHFPAADCVKFIQEVRSTHPRVAICRVAESKFLDAMPEFPEEWRERFKHYYRVATDLADADFEEEVGLVRDLFVADSVKTRALGHYVTTPGALIRPRAAMPITTWISFLGGLLAAAVGQFIGYGLRPPEKAAADQNKGNSEAPAAVAQAPAPPAPPAPPVPTASVAAAAPSTSVAPPAVRSVAAPPAPLAKH